jgi:hypothetical protein
MYVILPFEKDFYKKFEFETEFVGHPLLDAIEQYNDLDFENLPWDKSNLKTKPYDWNLNRCGRTMSTPSDSDISEWSKNPKNVLPIGIKKNEQCSYTEMYKIGVKLLQQVCGIQGVPLKFKEIIKEKINRNRAQNKVTK